MWQCHPYDVLQVFIFSPILELLFFERPCDKQSAPSIYSAQYIKYQPNLLTIKGAFFLYFRCSTLFKVIFRCIFVRIPAYYPLYVTSVILWPVSPKKLVKLVGDEDNIKVYHSKEFIVHL